MVKKIIQHSKNLNCTGSKCSGLEALCQHTYDVRTRWNQYMVIQVKRNEWEFFKKNSHSPSQFE
ncbi:hypothetical protein GCM10008931_24290 [Oceanobacillus oncorhynchi subsp. oncorhynchi]